MPCSRPLGLFGFGCGEAVTTVKERWSSAGFSYVGVVGEGIGAIIFLLKVLGVIVVQLVDVVKLVHGGIFS